MPSPNPTTRREYKGAAKATTLSALIVNGSDTSFTITDATGWPTGATGKFVVTINAGEADEEKILCTSRTGTTINVDTRGFDSTTAAGHAATATATHTISAFDADEWNAHTNASSAVHGVAGSVVGASDSQTLTNKTINLTSNTLTGTKAQFNTACSDADFATLTGSETLTNKTLTSPTINTPTVSSPTVTGATLDAASTIGGVSGTSLAADRTAWTTYTPTFTNCTSAAGDFAYKQIGKALYIRGHFTAGTATATGVIGITLPGGLSGVATQQFVPATDTGGGNARTWLLGSGASTLTSGFNPGAGGALTGLLLAGVIEIA